MYFYFFYPKKSSTDISTKKSADDAVRRRHNSQAVPKVSMDSSSKSSNCFRMNSALAAIAPVWFDYVAELNCNSLVRFSFQLEADFGRRAAIKEIYESLKRYLTNDSDVFAFAETNLQLGGRIFEMFVPSKLTVGWKLLNFFYNFF